MLVGLGTHHSGFVIFLVVVGGNSEGLVALLADDLVDVASGESENSFHFLIGFDMFIKYLFLGGSL